ncbi:hypothetical protein [Sphingorhabdus sp. Alg239-R122]|uniref:hypothetical protein n=1 Tax=Sphingorhabdus sp. Alg239-R122 TaxID=2305989 RepID=UPI0013D9A093|nr:hypothetical protein [Sphingorhabdus sp. Alg239-R122]
MIAWRVLYAYANAMFQARKTSIYTLPCAAALILGGCAMQDGEFPTLATRNVEKHYASAESDRQASVPVAPLNTEIAAQARKMLAKAQKGQRAFAEALPGARQSAMNARGAATGGESWAVATTQISALDISRGESAMALADLDQLYADQVTGEADSPATAQAIGDVRSKVYDMVQAQDSAITALRAMLSS